MRHRVAIAVDPRQATEQWQRDWILQMAAMVFATDPAPKTIAILSPATFQLNRLMKELAEVLENTVINSPVTTRICSQLADPESDDTAITRPIQEAIESLGREHDLVAVIGPRAVLNHWLGSRMSGSAKISPHLKHGQAHITDLTQDTPQYQILTPK